MKHHRKIEHIKILPGMKAKDLVAAMSGCVFGAGRIAKAAEIYNEMLSDKDCTIFFGVAGAMVPAGMRQILIDMLKSSYIDVFVCTGATLTHDLVEALGNNHFIGTANVDDSKLNKKGIDRIYESYMPNEVYEDMEDFFNKNFDKLASCKDITEFLWQIGALLKSESILKVCADRKIPIFAPAIADSGIGLMMYNKIAAGKKVEVSAFGDMKRIMDIAWKTKKPGVFYVGGGVPKNYIQQAMQLCPHSAAYGIQISIDSPQYGGSSGAELREGISWGKMSPGGKFTDVYCDSTIALPLIYSAVVGMKRK